MVRGGVTCKIKSINHVLTNNLCRFAAAVAVAKQINQKCVEKDVLLGERGGGEGAVRTYGRVNRALRGTSLLSIRYMRRGKGLEGTA